MHSPLPIFLYMLVSTAAGYILPGPTGKYNVTVTDGPLVDWTRNDPFAPTATPRALMLSVFQPATCASPEPVPYMPNATAEYQGPYLTEAFNITQDLTELFVEAELPVCPSKKGRCSPQRDTPLLLFSPGWGTPRAYYSVLASSIASLGFTVVTIDHPYDANIITYPDGHNVTQNLTTWNDGEPIESEHVRAADASFIVTQLRHNASAVAELLPQRGARVFRSPHIGMLGHSLGGASSLFAAAQDTRIKAAINWDGTIFGDLPEAGLSQPTLLLMDAETEIPPDWEAAWPLFHGPKLWVKVDNTTHQSFTDMATLVKAAGYAEEAAASGLQEFLGTIEPSEMVSILAESTAAWMKAAFESEKGGKFALDKGPGETEDLETLKKESF
jgi:predicted dienelactone hydrolase